MSCFSGNLRRDDRDNSRDCWRISDGNNFRVRSKHFCYDKTKVPVLVLVSFNHFLSPFFFNQYLMSLFCFIAFFPLYAMKIPAGKHLMDLVAVDWFKDTKRIDHVARRQGCAAQVSMRSYLFNFICLCTVLLHFRKLYSISLESCLLVSGLYSKWLLLHLLCMASLFCNII